MKRLRPWMITGAILVLLAAGFTGLLELSNARTFQPFGDLVARVETDRPVVALTFDDGPTVDYTQPVLDILAAHDIHATFFITGRETAENPEQARAIARAGHEIGNHSWSHSRMIFVTPDWVRAEIENTDAAIRSAGYTGPIHFRPPYGKKLVILPWFLAENQRTTIMWDVEPESDATVADNSQVMADYVIDKATNGSIIIMHVMYGSRDASRQALPAIIQGLKARGFAFATVSQLLSAP